MSFLANLAIGTGEQIREERETSQAEAKEESRYQRRLAEAKATLAEKRSYDKTIRDEGIARDETTYQRRKDEDEITYNRRIAEQDKKTAANLAKQESLLDRQANKKANITDSEGNVLQWNADLGTYEPAISTTTTEGVQPGEEFGGGPGEPLLNRKAIKTGKTGKMSDREKLLADQTFKVLENKYKDAVKIQGEKFGGVMPPKGTPEFKEWEQAQNDITNYTNHNSQTKNVDNTAIEEKIAKALGITNKPAKADTTTSTGAKDTTTSTGTTLKNVKKAGEMMVDDIKSALSPKTEKVKKNYKLSNDARGEMTALRKSLKLAKTMKDKAKVREDMKKLSNKDKLNTKSKIDLTIKKLRKEKDSDKKAKLRKELNELRELEIK